MVLTKTILNIILLFIFNIGSNLLLTPMLESIKLPYVILLFHTLLNIIISFIIFSVSSQSITGNNVTASSKCCAFCITNNIRKYFIVGLISTIFNLLIFYLNYKLEYFTISFVTNIVLTLQLLLTKKIKYFIVFMIGLMIGSVPDIISIINNKNIIWSILYTIAISFYGLYFHYIKSENNELAGLLLFSNCSQFLLLILFFWLDLIPNFGYSLTLASFISNFANIQFYFEIKYIFMFFGWSIITYLKYCNSIVILQNFPSPNLCNIIVSSNIMYSIIYNIINSNYDIIYQSIGFIIYTIIIIYMNISQENILIEDNTKDYVLIKDTEILTDEPGSTEIIIDEPGYNEEYKIIRKN